MSNIQGNPLKAEQPPTSGADSAWVLLAMIASTELSANTKAMILTAPSMTGYFAAILAFLENLSAQDDTAVDFSKPLAARLGALNECLVTFAKFLNNDAAAAQALHAVQMIKPLVEAATLQEAAQVAFAKSLLSQAATNAQSVTSFHKALDEGGINATLRLLDAASMAFGKVFADTGQTTSHSETSFSKDSQEAAATAHSASHSVAKVLADTSHARESMAVAMLRNRFFDDAFTAQALSATHIHKVLNDSIWLVEFLQLGQLTETSSTEGGALSDTQSVAIHKVLLETAALAETSAVAVQKVLQDAAQASVSAQVAVTKMLTDSASAFEASRAFVGKVLEQQAVAAAGGHAYLQSYCAADYFSADYTGTAYSI